MQILCQDDILRFQEKNGEGAQNVLLLHKNCAIGSPLYTIMGSDLNPSEVEYASLGISQCSISTTSQCFDTFSSALNNSSFIFLSIFAYCTAICLSSSTLGCTRGHNLFIAEQLLPPNVLQILKRKPSLSIVKI